MNYQKHYDLLIERARGRKLDGYVERHHVVPRCLGGDDSKENLVELTPEEHYVAHQLLVKIHPKNGRLVHAAVMMVADRPSNKLYGWLKKKQSIEAKKRTGTKNGSYGTRWVNDGKTSFKIQKDVPLQDGWSYGRKISKKICKGCSKDDIQTRTGAYCDSCRNEILLRTGKMLAQRVDGAHPRIKYQKEAIIKLLLETKSVTETMIRLGCPKLTGYTRIRIKQIFDELNLHD